MRALFDVNVLIALLDADHASHQRAMDYFAAQASIGWASCPLTQNGCVRIMSHPNYPNPLPVQAIIHRLGEACRHPVHEFWPDEVTVLDTTIFDAGRIHGPKQLTDLYLLALATRRDGCFVTFDRSIALDAVRTASRRHLVVL